MALQIKTPSGNGGILYVYFKFTFLLACLEKQRLCQKYRKSKLFAQPCTDLTIEVILTINRH